MLPYTDIISIAPRHHSSILITWIRLLLHPTRGGQALPTHNPLSPDHLHRTKVAQEVNRMEQRIKPDALCVVGNQSAGVVVDPLHFPGHTRTDDRASLNAFNGTLRPSLRSLVA